MFLVLACVAIAATLHNMCKSLHSIYAQCLAVFPSTRLPGTHFTVRIGRRGLHDRLQGL